MRIEKDQLIAGQPAINVRNFFKAVRRVDVYNTTHYLKLSDAEAEDVISRLEELEYIERDSNSGVSVWSITMLGAALSMATAAKPLLRKTADKKITEFLERINQVNADANYAYKIVKAVLFGSYLSDAERINDIDLAIELTARGTGEEYDDLCNKSIAKAVASGRRFANISAQVYWPENEIWMFLKGGSRALSLHRTDDPGLENSEQKVIFNITDT